MFKLFEFIQSHEGSLLISKCDVKTSSILFISVPISSGRQRERSYANLFMKFLQHFPELLNSLTAPTLNVVNLV